MPELYVSDYKKSLDFYTNILGFTIEYTRGDPPFAFLSFGDAQLMIQELREGEQVELGLERPFGRGINFEIRVDNISDIINRLEKNQYPLYKEVKDHGRYVGIAGKLRGSREAIVHDPDGYELRFAESLGVRESGQDKINIVD